MKIIKLQSENVKRLKAVEISPDGNLIVIGGNNAQGKQQPISEPVLTPTGFKPIGDIEPGDFVIGLNGLPTKVCGVFPQTVRKTYRVSFSDGSSTRCGPDHLWTVSRWKSGNGKNSVYTSTLTTEQILKGGLRASCASNTPAKKWWIPIHAPVHFSDTGMELPIEPYALGVILGDGHIERTGYTTITSWDEQIFEELGVDGWRAEHELGTGVWSRPLRHLGLAGKLAHEKFIPRVYFTGKPCDRMSLLKGLLDTDGTALESWASFASTSEQLAVDVAELGRSLGFVCSVRSTVKSYRYNGELKKGRVSWIVLVRSHKAPFRLARKKNRWSISKQRPELKRFIDSIVQVEDEDSVCISVTAKDGLYLTKDYIVTHNTSVLDSITMALAGKGAIPAQPVRNGEDKAKVVCELDDLTITRTFTQAGGGTLTVSNKDGAKYSSPQAMLDKLVGKLTFDPLGFSRMAPKDQAATLKSLVGLDFTKQDQERKRLYDERTMVNREGASLKAQFDAMPEHPDAPEQEVSAPGLVQELQARRKAERDRSQLVGEIERQANAGDALKKEIDELAARLHEKKRQLAAAGDELNRLNETLLNAPPLAPAEEIERQIATAEIQNRKCRENHQRKSLAEKLEAKRLESQSLSDGITAIDKAKSDALEATPFPVDGLGFSEQGVTFNGLPLEQASGAEQLRISAAIGLAMNPRLRVLLVRDGSLLDENGLQLLKDLAQERDAQIWLERVGKGAECSVIIEDGAVL